MDGAGTIRGALAGAFGTVVMTALSKRLAPLMLPDELRPSEFPPRRVVERAELLAGAPGALDEGQEDAATIAAHFGYGSSMGVLYGELREGLDDVSPPLLGALFGAGVWALGYAGWLPRIGVAEGTTAGPPERMVGPFLAHLVYGVSTALAYDRLRRVGTPPPATRTSSAPRPRPARAAASAARAAG